jgi:hypothetical protein
MMEKTEHRTLPAGRIAARWFLFLVFFHLLPVPWFMLVVPGLAPAYQNGRFDYPVDLLKSKALVELLVAAYRDGVYGVDRNAQKERYWTDQLKYFDRLFDMAGVEQRRQQYIRQQELELEKIIGEEN